MIKVQNGLRLHNGDEENEEYAMMLEPICQMIYDMISFLSACHLKTWRAIRDLLFFFGHGMNGEAEHPRTNGCRECCPLITRQQTQAGLCHHEPILNHFNSQLIVKENQKESRLLLLLEQSRSKTLHTPCQGTSDPTPSFHAVELDECHVHLQIRPDVPCSRSVLQVVAGQQKTKS